MGPWLHPDWTHYEHSRLNSISIAFDFCGRTYQFLSGHIQMHSDRAQPKLHQRPLLRRPAENNIRLQTSGEDIYGPNPSKIGSNTQGYLLQ